MLVAQPLTIDKALMLGFGAATATTTSKSQQAYMCKYACIEFEKFVHATYGGNMKDARFYAHENEVE